ncbi:MAG TPA: bifunctional DNA-formamidopyrimidine glycosylase/DNA-(apurinic or apyrimidinic site) lyase [Kofleriaceae bacterium]|nr:bifunctional DNA-formamidopyrimidine glycosylase/DNA-(apurinic or apyrimidinic site) lyase [Kofleriaceae bacterium]
MALPELPEVETVRRTLEPALGRRVVDVWTSGLPLRMNQPVDRAGLERAAVGATLRAVERHGKYLMLEFTGRNELVLVHLGMSGRLRLVPAGEPKAPHTHVVFGLDRSRHIRYSDPRRFGLVTVAPGGERRREHPALAELGLDPLLERVSGRFFHDAVARSAQMVKTLLLDQRILAGVGNIYACEALWLARIAPTVRGRDLGLARAGALVRAAGAVMRHALDRGGTSLRDFVDAAGIEGENAGYLRVYGREGEPCLRRGCGGRIRRVVIQGRATFYCPRCQRR